MFQRALVVDWETSGLPDEATPRLSYVEGPQGIEIGAVIVDLPTWRSLGEFSSRVKFLGTHNGLAYGGPATERLSWSDEAQKIHGIGVNELVRENSPVEVATAFISWVRSFVGTGSILICGQNPDFDAYFTRQLLYLAGRLADLRFTHRRIDTFTAGYLAFGCVDSNELYLLTSQKKRDLHNALEDARLAVVAMQQIVDRLRGAGFGTPSLLRVSDESMLTPSMV